MKKLFLFALIGLFILPPAAHAESREVQITDTMHRNFDGTFRNDDLAREIAVGGRLWSLIFSTDLTPRICVIDFWFMAGGKRIHKTVHHFIFKETGGLLAAQESEVDEVGWFPLADIVGLLAYPDEKKLIAKNSGLLA